MRKANASSAAASKPPRQLGIRGQKAARKHLDEMRAANQSGKVKRLRLDRSGAAEHSGLTKREIIAALKKEFG